MICLSSKLPVLQVGSYQLKDYDTSWILRSIEDALDCVEIHSKLVADVVYRGVLQYLEHECPWVPLRIEDLYIKIEMLFDKIGFMHISHSIPRYSPVVKISVEEQLYKLEQTCPNALLETLKGDFKVLEDYGVEQIILDNVVDAVQILIPDNEWNEESQKLYNEILALQEVYNEVSKESD